MTLSFSQKGINPNTAGTSSLSATITFTTNFLQGQGFIGSGFSFGSSVTVGNITTVSDGTKTWNSTQVIDFLNNVDSTPFFIIFLPNLTTGNNTVTFTSSKSMPGWSFQGHIINNAENGFIAGHAINFSQNLSSSPTTTANINPAYPGSYVYQAINATFNSSTTLTQQAGFTLANTSSNTIADAYAVQTNGTTVSGQWTVTTGSNQDYSVAITVIGQALCHGELPSIGVGCLTELGAAFWAAKKLEENAVIPRRSLLLLEKLRK